MQASIDKVKELKDEGKIEVYTKYQLDSVKEMKKLKVLKLNMMMRR